MEKVNIGKMVSKMQLFKPESTESTTGEDIVNYIPSIIFLSEIVAFGGNSERLDDALSGKIYLKFNSSNFNISTEYKIEYEGVMFDVDKISLTGRDLYATYECSKNNLE